jgi:hypothetical protein
MQFDHSPPVPSYGALAHKLHTKNHAYGVFCTSYKTSM